MNLSGFVEGSVKLNQNILFVCVLSKGRTSEVTEYMNLELSENDKGDDHKGKQIINPKRAEINMSRADERYVYSRADHNLQFTETVQFLQQGGGGL